MKFFWQLSGRSGGLASHIQCLKNQTSYIPSLPIRPRIITNHDKQMFHQGEPPYLECLLRLKLETISSVHTIQHKRYWKNVQFPVLFPYILDSSCYTLAQNEVHNPLVWCKFHLSNFFPRTNGEKNNNKIKCWGGGVL